MGWEQKTVRLGPDDLAASVKHLGPQSEAVIQWREDIGVGCKIAIDNAVYAVTEVRDPGGRHETLELVLDWVSNTAPAKVTHSSATPEKKRKPALKREARDVG